MIYLVSKSLNLFTDENYNIISVGEAILIISSWKVIQFDSETDGRDAHINKLLCIQLGNDKADIRIIIDALTIDIKLFKNLLEEKLLIGHNLKFDLQFLYNYGIIPLHVYDTMIVEQFLHLGYPPYPKPGGISYALNAVALRYLNINIDKSVRGEIIWRGLDSKVILYAAGDVTYLEKIMWKQVEECKKKICLAGAKLECNFVPVIAYLEWCGIKLDQDKWKVKMQHDQESLEKRKEALDNFVENRYSSSTNYPFAEVNLQGDLFSGFDTRPHCTINWNSGSQVVEYLKYLGFNTTTTDKETGENKDSALEKLIKSQKGIEDEFLKLYFDYKESFKVCSTYGETQLDAVNPITGRIHTSYKQLGAASGRMSCGSMQSNTDLAKLKKLPENKVTYPNIQQLPSNEETRSCFIAEKGNLFCSCDYSAIESRLGGDIYQDQAILDEFLHRSGDMHSLVAKMIFPELKDIPIEQIKKVRPDLRSRAKPVEFSQQFGGSEYAIASSLGCSLEEAKKIKEFYDSGFKGVTEFKKKGSKFVRQNGYVLMCKYTGHKMYWWDWKNWLNEDISDTESKKRHYKIASKWDRMALNGPTQGSGAIILKDAMIDFFHWIVDNGYFNVIKIVALVHDEACIEYPEFLSHTANKLEEIMENSAAKYCKSLPIPAEASVGKYWIH